MMLFTSIYGVVDGLFVSNVVGESAFASINLIMPFCMIFSALGSVFGVGGSALVALEKGKGNDEKANRIFSMLVYTMIAAGIGITLIAELLLPAACRFLGATDNMMDNCILYGRIFLTTQAAFLMQYAFQTFLITAERPKLGLAFTLAAGIGNMILDWLFISVFKWGVAGAAVATCIGQCIGGIGPLIYFIAAKDCSLKLVRTHFMPRALLKSASNGAADGITNIAMSLVNMVFNVILMKYIGEYGVSAYGVIMYVNFVFVAIYLGYSMGVAPVISYHYGAGSSSELKGLFKKSLIISSLLSIVLTTVALISARGIASFFAGYDEEFLNITTRALRLYSISYIFSGINIFGATLFSALNNGLIAGVLSGARMFVFQLLAVILLPMLIGSDGIWLSIVIAETASFILTVISFLKYRKKYGYA